MTSQPLSHSSVSRQFSKFIFGVVLEDIRRPNIVLKIEEPPFQFRTSQISKESLRNLFKYLDFKYPRSENGEPLSYTKLTSKQMTEHIAWIERTAAFSGVTLNYIEESWERVMQNIRR